MTTDWSNISVVSRRPCSRLWEIVFRHAWNASLGRPMRILVLGDSQEADQDGVGYRYVPALNHAAAMTFGNWSEGPLGEPRSVSRNPGTLTGMRTGRIDGTDASITSTLKPPGFSLTGYSYTSANTGMFFALQPDWRGVAPDLKIGGGEYMDRATALVAADVFGWTKTGASGEFAWSVKRTDRIDAYESGGSVAFSGTTSLALQDAAAPFVKGQTIGGNWTFSSNQVLQLLLTGNHATNGAILAAARFRNTARTWGMVAQSMGAAGHSVADYTGAAHAGQWQFWRAAGPYDLVWCNLVCNDIYTDGISAAQHKTDLHNLIDLIRGSNGLRDGGIPIVINHDSYRIDGTNDQDTQYALCAEKHREIEAERGNVISLNTLLASRVGGLNPGNTSLAGLTDKGAWAASTAYVVGDRVYTSTPEGFASHYRCVADHTSAAADAPNRQNNSSIARWVPIRMSAFSTQPFDATTDATHHSAFGARLKAQADWQAMLMAAGAGAPTRSRFN